MILLFYGGGVEPTILTQNVLQDLTPFVEEGLFDGHEWNLKEEMFGGYYLLNDEFGLTYFPLIVNLTMLEQVPGLIDELGYPMDLFEEGKWTWNTFKDYLSRVDAYYRNNDAKDGAWIDRQAAYETDHRYAALGAIHANGGAIFSGEVTADSKEVIDAVAYIKDLMDADLLLDCGLYDDGYTPRWCDGGADFGIGNTVFTDAPNWNIGWYASQCAERGESIAIIPWPRPDRMSSVDDPDYMQSTNGGNSVAILKGVSEEKTRLAIQTYILYWNTYYQALGGVDSVADYQAQTAVTELANRGVDVYNEVYGQSAIDCYTFILSHMNNNWAHTLGLWDGRWETILGESLYGLNGTGSYDVAIQARKTELSNRIETISAALKSGEIHDTYKPTLTSETAVLEAGTDPATVDWTRYFTAEDTVDGVIAITADNITVSEDLDLATPGEYGSAVKVEVSDSSDNSANTSITVIVYDADNKTAPTVKAKEELPVIALNTETSGIDWTAYLETAEDADGINVKSKVTANLSTLDTTTPGTYSVTLTVTDYAGNSAEVTVDVTVE